MQIQFFVENRWFLKDSEETDSTIVFLALRRFGWSNYQLKRTMYRSSGAKNVIIIIIIISILTSIEWRPKADLAAEGPNLAEGPKILGLRPG